MRPSPQRLSAAHFPRDGQLGGQLGGQCGRRRGRLVVYGCALAIRALNVGSAVRVNRRRRARPRTKVDTAAGAAVAQWRRALRSCGRLLRLRGGRRPGQRKTSWIPVDIRYNDKRDR